MEERLVDSLVPLLPLVSMTGCGRPGAALEDRRCSGILSLSRLLLLLWDNQL